MTTMMTTPRTRDRETAVAAAAETIDRATLDQRMCRVVSTRSGARLYRQYRGKKTSGRRSRLPGAFIQLNQQKLPGCYLASEQPQ